MRRWRSTSPTSTIVAARCLSAAEREVGVARSAWPGRCSSLATAPAAAPSLRLCLTGKDRSGCRGLLGERDGVAEALELFDEAVGLAVGVALGEVIGAEVAVGLAGGKPVPDRAEQGVLGGAQGAFVAASWLEAPVLRGGVVGLGPGWRPWRLLRARSPATLIRRGSGRSGACRP